MSALKFSRLLVVAELGAALIAAGAPPELLSGTLVPVPPAALRLASRGFDPARELAGALGERCGIDVSDCLWRRDGRPQRGRTRAQRLGRPPRFAARAAVPIRAVLIDDVATTGATLDACAGALREAGSRWVGAVVLAAVSPPRKSLRSASRAA